MEVMETTGTTRLNEARTWLRQRLKPGAPCPCCTQFSKIYTRKLNSTMARGLLWIVKESGPDRKWVKYMTDGPKWLTRVGGTFALLAHWELIEQKPQLGTEKSHSGIWRPTQAGIDFANYKTEVPSHVKLYDGRLMGFVDTTTDIVDSLGKHFDYAELMGE